MKVIIKTQGITEPLTCEGETIVVNLHGALISTAVPLSKGMRIEIEVNLTSKRANAEVVYVDPKQPRPTSSCSKDRGLLKVSQPGLRRGSFKPMDTLNEGAHASFRAFMTCIGLARHPENLPTPDDYCKHLQRYCANLDYMHGMFKAGKEKKHVLDGVISLHRPAK